MRLQTTSRVHMACENFSIRIILFSVVIIPNYYYCVLLKKLYVPLDLVQFKNDFPYFCLVMGLGYFPGLGLIFVFNYLFGHLFVFFGMWMFLILIIIGGLGGILNFLSWSMVLYYFYCVILGFIIYRNDRKDHERRERYRAMYCQCRQQFTAPTEKDEEELKELLKTMKLKNDYIVNGMTITVQNHIDFSYINEMLSEKSKWLVSRSGNKYIYVTIKPPISSYQEKMIDDVKTIMKEINLKNNWIIEIDWWEWGSIVILSESHSYPEIYEIIEKIEKMVEWNVKIVRMENGRGLKLILNKKNCDACGKKERLWYCIVE